MNSGTVLTILGVALIWGVLWVMNGPVPSKREFRCDSRSPDGLYECVGGIAHVGWCHNGDVQWRYESWAIGADDDTLYAAEPQQVDPPTRRIGRHRRLPRSALVLGVLAVVGVTNYAYDTDRPVEPTPQSYDCDWKAVRCENWTSR